MHANPTTPAPPARAETPPYPNALVRGFAWASGILALGAAAMLMLFGTPEEASIIPLARLDDFEELWLGVALVALVLITGTAHAILLCSTLLWERFKTSRPPGVRKWLRLGTLAVVPCLLVTTFAFDTVKVPMHTHLLLSKPALDQVTADPAAFDGPRRVGMFRVATAGTVEDCTWVLFGDRTPDSVFDRVDGIIRCEDGPPPGSDAAGDGRYLFHRYYEGIGVSDIYTDGAGTDYDSYDPDPSRRTVLAEPLGPLTGDDGWHLITFFPAERKPCTPQETNEEEKRDCQDS